MGGTIGLLAVKAKITLPAKANFGSVNTAIRLFSGKKIQPIWLLYVTTVGMMFRLKIFR